MANPEHLALLDHGVAQWNEWRLRSPQALPDLSDATLSGKQLAGIDLYCANLNGALLCNTNLNGANCTKATFNNANLMRASLEKAT
jgi:uncharacterized protein YjbI with pentapeptide repeats